MVIAPHLVTTTPASTLKDVPKMLGTRGGPPARAASRAASRPRNSGGAAEQGSTTGDQPSAGGGGGAPSTEQGRSTGDQAGAPPTASRRRRRSRSRQRSRVPDHRGDLPPDPVALSIVSQHVDATKARALSQSRPGSGAAKLEQVQAVVAAVLHTAQGAATPTAGTTSSVARPASSLPQSQLPQQLLKSAEEHLLNKSSPTSTSTRRTSASNQVQEQSTSSSLGASTSSLMNTSRSALGISSSTLLSTSDDSFALPQAATTKDALEVEMEDISEGPRAQVLAADANEELPLAIVFSHAAGGRLKTFYYPIVDPHAVLIKDLKKAISKSLAKDISGKGVSDLISDKVRRMLSEEAEKRTEIDRAWQKYGAQYAASSPSGGSAAAAWLAKSASKKAAEKSHMSAKERDEAQKREWQLFRGLQLGTSMVPNHITDEDIADSIWHYRYEDVVAWQTGRRTERPGYIPLEELEKRWREGLIASFTSGRMHLMFENRDHQIMEMLEKKGSGVNEPGNHGDEGSRYYNLGDYEPIVAEKRQELAMDFSRPDAKTLHRLIELKAELGQYRDKQKLDWQQEEPADWVGAVKNGTPQTWDEYQKDQKQLRRDTRKKMIVKLPSAKRDQPPEFAQALKEAGNDWRRRQQVMKTKLARRASVPTSSCFATYANTKRCFDAWNAKRLLSSQGDAAESTPRAGPGSAAGSGLLRGRAAARSSPTGPAEPDAEPDAERSHELVRLEARPPLKQALEARKLLRVRDSEQLGPVVLRILKVAPDQDQYKVLYRVREEDAGQVFEGHHGNWLEVFCGPQGDIAHNIYIPNVRADWWWTVQVQQHGKQESSQKLVYLVGEPNYDVPRISDLVSATVTSTDGKQKQEIAEAANEFLFYDLHVDPQRGPFGSKAAKTKEKNRARKMREQEQASSAASRARTPAAGQRSALKSTEAAGTREASASTVIPVHNEDSMLQVQHLPGQGGSGTPLSAGTRAEPQTKSQKRRARSKSVTSRRRSSTSTQQEQLVSQTGEEEPAEETSPENAPEKHAEGGRSGRGGGATGRSSRTQQEHQEHQQAASAVSAVSAPSSSTTTSRGQQPRSQQQALGQGVAASSSGAASGAPAAATRAKSRGRSKSRGRGTKRGESRGRSSSRAATEKKKKEQKALDAANAAALEEAVAAAQSANSDEGRALLDEQDEHAGEHFTQTTKSCCKSLTSRLKGLFISRPSGGGHAHQD
ncbi:unnamed protein product [Amoebophrya sp. A25]|nr:unnamed protein product [Amoebophrya sp. A25]|eukprot:GSA25T00003441001.1